MQHDILVTILTVSYNSEKTVSHTIESVLNQSYKNIEYILVDGDSKDKSVEVANNYKKKFSDKGIDYTVISEPDNGMYDALNKGIKKAKGLIIGSINSDDWYELDAVENVVKTYIETQFDMFYADVRLIKPNGNIIKHSKKSCIISSRYWNHPTTFITKEMYNKYQYSLYSGYDDFDLMVRIHKNNHRIIVKNIVIANFIYGGISTKITLNDVFNRIKGRYNVYRNNNLSRLYLFECILVEVAKFIFYRV
jgi:glycosyltransferase involved in cell wall biosynthesis